MDTKTTSACLRLRHRFVIYGEPVGMVILIFVYQVQQQNLDGQGVPGDNDSRAACLPS